MDYIKFAISADCQPDRFLGDLDESKLDRTVLDERCRETLVFLASVAEFLQDDTVLDENSSELISVLQESLSKFQNSSGRYILSLSGGVDSMSVLVLLLKAKVDFVAVHIRHSSRLEDTRMELEWVQFVCKTLNVPLYYHHVQVARPHATTGSSEITRDQFENLTRQIRFGMYRKAFDSYCNESPNETAYVVIGHHLDDVDENRIAELGKGNLINIDGMAEDDGDDGSNGPDVVVLRPLCRVIRKDQLREFARTHLIPHMQNSTPKWSKRGWIRDVLDDANTDREWVLSELDRIGTLSREIDATLDSVVSGWLAHAGIESNQILSVVAKSKQFQIRCGLIRLDLLQEQLSEVFAKLRDVACMCNVFGERFNEKVAEFRNRDERKDLSCPIQDIRSWDIEDQRDMRSVIYVKVFQRAFPALKELIESLDRYVSKKSITQLLENLDAKTMKVWINWKLNNLKQEICLVQLAPSRIAILNMDDVNTVTANQFEGNREALKKTVSSNAHRTTINRNS